MDGIESKGGSSITYLKFYDGNLVQEFNDPPSDPKYGVHQRTKENLTTKEKKQVWYYQFKALPLFITNIELVVDKTSTGKPLKNFKLYGTSGDTDVCIYFPFSNDYGKQFLTVLPNLIKAKVDKQLVTVCGYKLDRQDKDGKVVPGKYNFLVKFYYGRIDPTKDLKGLDKEQKAAITVPVYYQYDQFPKVDYVDIGGGEKKKDDIALQKFMWDEGSRMILLATQKGLLAPPQGQQQIEKPIAAQPSDPFASIPSAQGQPPMSPSPVAQGTPTPVAQGTPTPVTQGTPPEYKPKDYDPFAPAVQQASAHHQYSAPHQQYSAPAVVQNDDPFFDASPNMEPNPFDSMF